MDDQPVENKVHTWTNPNAPTPVPAQPIVAGNMDKGLRPCRKCKSGKAVPAGSPACPSCGRTEPDKKKPKSKPLRVKMYFQLDELEAVAREAEAAKCRRPGLPVLVQARNQKWTGKIAMVANTDGIARYFKKCREDLKKLEAFRAELVAKELREKQAQEERLAALGYG